MSCDRVRTGNLTVQWPRHSVAGGKQSSYHMNTITVLTVVSKVLFTVGVAFSFTVAFSLFA